jgi:hypothetical protein
MTNEQRHPARREQGNDENLKCQSHGGTETRRVDGVGVGTDNLSGRFFLKSFFIVNQCEPV